MTTFIYRLCDQDGTVRYVGRSSNPITRLFGHLVGCVGDTTPVAHWLRGYRKVLKLPLIKVVRKCEGDGRTEECEEIRRAVEKGWPILNVQGAATKVYVGVRIDEDDLKALKRLGNNLSEMIQVAVREYLERHGRRKTK